MPETYRHQAREQAMRGASFRRLLTRDLWRG
jgi:hypothetical protein